MADVLAPMLVQKFWSNNGIPLANGQLFSYQAGTTTPLATYTDSTGGTPNTNPIVLNARGEANIWIPSNVAYKFVLEDSAGNTIWTVDQVVNSQLITLYGGVDEGTVNTYSLTFTANFSALADGIIIYWIPANTNTGPSTLSVNGLGTQNIVNPDGSALRSSQIIAGQPVTVLYKAGAWELITPSTVIYGSTTGAWTGFSVSPASAVIGWRKNGSLVTIFMPIGTGTSNAANFLWSGLPSYLIPSAYSQGLIPCIGMVDNGSNVSSCSIASINNSGTITFYKDPSGTGWTSSGNKGFWANAQFTYTL